MPVRTTYIGGKTYVDGFSPYRRQDVKVGQGGYVQIDLKPFGQVWATAWLNSKVTSSMTGEDYTVEGLRTTNRIAFVPTKSPHRLIGAF